MKNTTTSLEKKHFPVMLDEVIQTCLPISKDNLIVDCTFGGGGYSKELLKLPNVKVIALDRDKSVIGRAKKLEKNFANYLNCKYAISTSSCTGAMHIALLALGIKEGDEIILPNITWVATANAIAYVNATPVFADIDLDYWCIDPNKIEKLITKKTKAIMPVHLYGQPCNMEKINKIAKKHNLFVIEDAAPAIGAKFKNKKCGTFGHFGAFSFQGAKLLVSGEGGMLVTNNKNLYLKALKISNQGRNYKKTFYIDCLGLKYKMSNIQAALALAQLERVEELIALKRRIFSWYEKYLKNLDSISLNHEKFNTKSIYWMTSLILNKKAKINRDKLIQNLLKNNIDSRPVFPELSNFKYWIKKCKNRFNTIDCM
jgi:perosamine synthetase